MFSPARPRTGPAAIARWAMVLSLTLLTSCGGGSKATVGGTVNGLTPGASVTLQDNLADNLTVPADQGFSFATTIAAGAAYSVTVLNQPVGESCAVSNGAGNIDSFGDDITDVAVTCSLTSSVGGTVSGLAVGNSVLLATNGLQLGVASNGAFAFAGVLPAGTAYDVTIAAQPAQQTCTITNGSGVVASGAVAAVSITCQ